MSSSHRFVGKIAIVTGGASGIGRATAQRLSDEGAAVAIFDRQAEAAEAVAETLPRAMAAGVDVSNEAAVLAATQAVADRWGAIDILVNNAGGVMAQKTPIWEFDLAKVRRITEVNYLSQWICTQAALPWMRDRGESAIVNIASMSGIHTVNGMAAYGAAKAAVINLTQALSRELGPLAIRVNAIAPGFIQIGGAKTLFTPEQLTDMEQTATQMQSLNRIGRPEDIAAGVAFLCSADAAHITGQVLPINGGS